MIKAVLLDLDDTLVISHTMEMFRAYLGALGAYSSRYGNAQEIAHQVMTAYGRALHQYAPGQTLMDRFFAEFAYTLGEVDSPALREFFEAFYVCHYPAIVQEYVIAQPGASDLLALLARREMKVVIATNPVLPERAAICRLEQGGLSRHKHSFELITSFENMHFGKPQPEYYEEILLRLDIEPTEALMVGDSFDNDIVPARIAGLNTYWVVNANDKDMPQLSKSDGAGTFLNLLALIESGWLRRLAASDMGVQNYLYRLAAFPSALYTLMEGISPEILACSPEESALSARDIVHHLLDREREEDRIRLERIINEENPFLSGNYVPTNRQYDQQDDDVWLLLDQFVQERERTVEWIRALDADVWERKARHAIFGSTTFGEMIKFAAEHDRTHYRQMIETLRIAQQVCA